MVKGVEKTVPLDIVSIPDGPLAVAVGDYDGGVYTDVSQSVALPNPSIGTTTGLAYAYTKKHLVRAGASCNTVSGLSLATGSNIVCDPVNASYCYALNSSGCTLVSSNGGKCFSTSGCTGSSSFGYMRIVPGRGIVYGNVGAMEERVSAQPARYSPGSLPRTASSSRRGV